MANFDKYSNYNEKHSFSGVVFGANAPVLEVELNEMQQIFNTKINRLIRTLGFGIIPLSDDSISFDAGSLTLTVKDSYIIDKSGMLAYVDSASVVMTSVNNVAYFKMQEVEATKSTSLKSYGNTAGASVNNPIQDNRFPMETTRRKLVTYTLMCGNSLPASTNTIRYISVGIYRADSQEFLFDSWGVKDVVVKNSISMSRQPNTPVGKRSTALGNKCSVTGDNSFASGYGNVVSGAQSASPFGTLNQCIGDYSFVGGYNNISKKGQVVFGHNCDDTLATEASNSGTDGTAMTIGNGYASTRANAFRFQYDGSMYAKGAYNATGADYAEYAEWADGNPDNEDRRGYFVTFDEEKPNMIRKAKADDIDILGVVSGNPCVIGNSDECWTKKFLTDDFGNYLYETVEEEVEIVDPETEEVQVFTQQVRQYILNPDFNDEEEYVHRSERPEWSAVGWIGVLPVREDGTCEVGGYCTWSDDGLATKAEPSRFNYKVVERVTENIVKVVIK